MRNNYSAPQRKLFRRQWKQYNDYCRLQHATTIIDERCIELYTCVDWSDAVRDELGVYLKQLDYLQLLHTWCHIMSLSKGSHTRLISIIKTGISMHVVNAVKQQQHEYEVANGIKLVPGFEPREQ